MGQEGHVSWRDPEQQALCAYVCARPISLSSQHLLPQELLRCFWTAFLPPCCEIRQPNLPSSPGSLRQVGGSATAAAGAHRAPPGPSDLKAAIRVSAMDLSCGPALSEMLCLPLALHICRTQVTRSISTSFLIPGPLCEEESLC